MTGTIQYLYLVACAMITPLVAYHMTEVSNPFTLLHLTLILITSLDSMSESRCNRGGGARAVCKIVGRTTTPHGHRAGLGLIGHPLLHLAWCAFDSTRLRPDFACLSTNPPILVLKQGLSEHLQN